MRRLNVYACILCILFLQQSCKNATEKGNTKNQTSTVSQTEIVQATEDSITVDSNSISKKNEAIQYSKQNSLQSIVIRFSRIIYGV